MENVKIAVIGLGKTRGYPIFELLYGIKRVKICGLCDLNQERIDEALKYIKSKNGEMPYCTTDYNKLLSDVELDAVFISTSWAYHVDIAVAAMERGIFVGMEVGGAYSEEDCWNLVRTHERTKTPFAFMENCCFDRSELLALKMARAGKFGKIVHCSGAYAHDLREEVLTGKEKKHYRLKEYLYRNCENYPTHDLGPIAKVLDINRGNRMLSLVSVATASFGMEEYAKQQGRTEFDNVRFHQADVVTTIIKCAGGETITLKLDTTLPRYYDRAFTVQGTKGMFNQSVYTVWLDEVNKGHYDTYEKSKVLFGNAKDYEEEYLPEVWRNLTKDEEESGHGGMDIFMLREWVKCIQNKKPFPLDVYDAASWMSISYLTEQSIINGGQQQAIPDFTRGKWINRDRFDVFDD